MITYLKNHTKKLLKIVKLRFVAEYTYIIPGHHLWTLPVATKLSNVAHLLAGAANCTQSVNA